jgi:Fe-S-cluster formation regulator IscX/YfhJ
MRTLFSLRKTPSNDVPLAMRFTTFSEVVSGLGDFLDDPIMGQR